MSEEISSYDEAYESLEAWRVMTQPGYHPIFFPGNFGVEPMFIYLTSLAFRLFGAIPIVMRAVAAVVRTLTVPALFGLGLAALRGRPQEKAPQGAYVPSSLHESGWDQAGVHARAGRAEGGW